MSNLCALALIDAYPEATVEEFDRNDWLSKAIWTCIGRWSVSNKVPFNKEVAE